jgi:drug/metabolite transporter (DMT)-like permease
MTSHSNTMTTGTWGLLVLLSVLWGGSFLFVGLAIRELPPLTVVAVRVVFAAFALLPLHVVMVGRLPRDGRTWIGFAGMALFNNVVPFTLIATGQAYIPAGLASVINATTPLFAVVLLAIGREEPLSLRKALGIVIGVGGVAVLEGAAAGGARQTTGIILCLAAAMSYGVSALWVKKFLRGAAPLTMATGQLLCSAAAMLVLAFVFDDPGRLLATSTSTWEALLGLAFLSTALAYLVFFRIISQSGPANVLLVTMLIPVSAIIMGYLVLNELIERREIIGALIIVAALALIDGRIIFGVRKVLGRNRLIQL